MFGLGSLTEITACAVCHALLQSVAVNSLYAMCNSSKKVYNILSLNWMFPPGVEKWTWLLIRTVSVVNKAKWQVTCAFYDDFMMGDDEALKILWRVGQLEGKVYGTLQSAVARSNSSSLLTDQLNVVMFRWYCMFYLIMESRKMLCFVCKFSSCNF